MNGYFERVTYSFLNYLIDRNSKLPEELKKMKVKDSITMDMERLNIQRLSVTAGALLTRELMKPAENKGITILGG